MADIKRLLDENDPGLAALREAAAPVHPVLDWIAEALEAAGAPHITDRGLSIDGTGDLWLTYAGREYCLQIRLSNRELAKAAN